MCKRKVVMLGGGGRDSPRGSDFKLQTDMKMYVHTRIIRDLLKERIGS